MDDAELQKRASFTRRYLRRKDKMSYARGLMRSRHCTYHAAYARAFALAAEHAREHARMRAHDYLVPAPANHNFVGRILDQPAERLPPVLPERRRACVDDDARRQSFADKRARSYKVSVMVVHHRARRRDRHSVAAAHRPMRPQSARALGHRRRQARVSRAPPCVHAGERDNLPLPAAAGHSTLNSSGPVRATRTCWPATAARQRAITIAATAGAAQLRVRPRRWSCIFKGQK